MSYSKELQDNTSNIENLCDVAAAQTGDAISKISAENYRRILDSFSIASLYVITEAEHKILYFNRLMKERMPDIEIGKICYELFKCNRDFCPVRSLNGEQSTCFLRYDERYDDNVEVLATRLLWQDGTPAILVCVKPCLPEETILGRTSGLNDTIAFVPKMQPLVSLPERREQKKRVVVGQYSESIYYLDGSTSVSDKEQAYIDQLLLVNHGVGILAGCFDENCSISMISELAVRVLNYSGYTEFDENTGSCLLNTVETEAEKEFIRSKLENPDDQIWTYPLRGKDGESISVRICNTIGIAPSGKRMWYMSLRRFSEHLHDSLTGGFNREGFIQAVEELNSYGMKLTDYNLLYLDIRGFKGVNDLYGSDSGDALLLDVYKRMLSSKLQPDICARQESDHFLMLVKKTNMHFGELSKFLNICWKHDGRTLILQAVCGICDIDDEDMNPVTMIDRARTAMEFIQDEYVTPFIIYNEKLHSHDLNRINILSSFEDGLKNGEFKIYYQPIMDVKTGKVVSAEALSRWVTKEQGVVPPMKFIPELERSGYIVQLDRYVVQHVGAFQLERKKAGLQVVPISANLSQMDFFDTPKVTELLEYMRDNPLLCDCLRLEITESSHASIQEKQQYFIEELHKYNGLVYIDDFGSGTASLDMVCEFNFDVMKLDMHFITKMIQKRKSYMLVKKMIEMAHDMGMKIVAEGVETEEQFKLLKKADCDYIQGYFFSKPIDEESFKVFLSEHL